MIKRIQALFLIGFLFAGVLGADARAQVTATIGDISGTTNDVVSVPITLSGIESSSGFNSFSFDVNMDNANGNISYLGHDVTLAGTTIASWPFVQSRANDVNFPNSLSVGGFTQSNSPVIVSGVLVYLRFQILGIVGGGSVTIEGLDIRSGATPLIFPFPDLVAGLNISNPPVAVDDAYVVSEGGAISPDAAAGVLANDTDADLDPLTAIIDALPTNGGVTFNADGSFTYTHNGSETTSDSFSYTVSDGSSTDTGMVDITIAPVNDPPAFTSVMSSQSIYQGLTVTHDYDATDAENDLLTYAILSGPAGASINASTGEFSWTAATAGAVGVVVTVSDGTATVQAILATITVNAVERYSATMFGWNEPTPVVTGASGSASLLFIPDAEELQVEGEFADLSSPFAVAELGIGVFGAQGTFVHSLTVTLVGGQSMAGSLPNGSNVLDLDALSYPNGVTKASFIQGIRDGEVYLNIRTINNLEGEVRGYLRSSEVNPNHAPTVMNPAGPLAADITGNPSDALFDVTWTGAPTDADGDEVRLLLAGYATSISADMIYLTDVSVTTGSAVSILVSEAADLFDQLSGGTPGNIQLGGTEPIMFSLIATDGSASTFSANESTVDLVRGMITALEDEALPKEFVLKGNYPNPFNPSTNIEFDLPESADVEVAVLDLLGRTMLTVPAQTFSAGASHSISLDASSLASGIYMYRVLARSASQTHVSTGTMTLIK